MDISVNKDPLAQGLVRVFSRYCDLIIQRLNKIPDKNRIAFLNVLNVSRIPPVPAQVPLTFTPVKTLPLSSSGIVVPARTKVAASPGEGETESTVFETLFDLTVTNLELKKILAEDPHTDRIGDHSILTTSRGDGPGQFAFAADQPARHEFCLELSSVADSPGSTQLRVQFDIRNDSASHCPRQTLQWYIPTQDGEIELTPVKDTTLQLSQSGEIIFKNLPQWPSFPMGERNSRWLGCRLLDPMPITDKGEKTKKLSFVTSVMITDAKEIPERRATGAFFNNLALDISKAFFPLGPMPEFGDTFYLDCNFIDPELSATHDCEITLKIKMVNPASSVNKTPIAPAGKAGNPKVQWEHWDGRQWAVLTCTDETQALTENGRVSFVLPRSSPQTTVNGTEGIWVRARLISGDYGKKERFEFNGTEQRFRHIPDTLAPPCIDYIMQASSLKAGPEPPALILTNNGLVLRQYDCRTSFYPFHGASEPHKALYLGFKDPHGNPKTFQDRLLDLYFHVSGTEGPASLRDQTDQIQLTWQYWNGNQWIKTRAGDATGALHKSGMVSVRTGIDAAAWNECAIQGAHDLYWLRALRPEPTYSCRPTLQYAALNTVPARQTLTMENELLGSSNGMPMQTFKTSRRPIIDDLHLRVRELDIPSKEELKKIYKQEGMEAVRISRNAFGEIKEVWIRWHEVNDFTLSTAQDRHFVVDRQKGEIQFGDGKHGLIPVAGFNNVQLSRYQTGGGSLGNKSTGSITQLRNSVPYIDSVINHMPALGGQDIESWDSVRERGSRWLRHRDRAVTIEDYEDLAGLAAPNIAKVKCCANCDLTLNGIRQVTAPGIISLIIVPREKTRKPLPDMNLLNRVFDFINPRRLPDADLVVVAPEYVHICVDATLEITGSHSQADVLDQCRLILDQYLHPLTGGDNRIGWEFGEKPDESDFYALLESIRGVDHVCSLNFRLKEETPGLLQKGIFLITPGEHDIRAGI